jgi:peptidoglycan/xylan/chitin deacetylase (PgdA/CDA1 family)
MGPLSRVWRREAGGPNLFSTAGSFSPPVGSFIEDSIHGYYIDFRLKAESPSWPPPFYRPDGGDVYVGLAQWGLGCYERYLWGDGEEWLAAAITTAEELLSDQQLTGPRAGGWLHRFALGHTYRILAPWLSAMAQGEGASLLVRLWRETGEERYAERARLALGPMLLPVARGGVAAELDGGYFPEEYPSIPHSYVLNGALFALWGCYDLGVALSDREAAERFEDGAATLARNLHRYDLGYWSRYDLFPHPVINIASSAYQVLHARQLEAMSRIADQPEFAEYGARFAEQAESKANARRAFARKAAFRLAVPRNKMLAHRLPWAHSGPAADVVVLCYHALSETWPAVLSVTPQQFELQIELMLRRGYVGATFHDAVHEPPGEKVFAVTFDDSYRSVNRLAAPILERLGIPGTVFVPTSFVGSEQPMSWAGIDGWLDGPHAAELVPMSWQELRSLATAGWEIGSHTRTHPRLPELTDPELAEELSASRDELERGMGLPCLSLAFPYGAEDERVVRATETAGYTAAAALPSPLFHNPQLLRWPRVGVYHDDELSRFRRKVSPAVRWARSQPAWKLVQARHRLKPKR